MGGCEIKVVSILGFFEVFRPLFRLLYEREFWLTWRNIWCDFRLALLSFQSSVLITQLLETTRSC